MTLPNCLNLCFVLFFKFYINHCKVRRCHKAVTELKSSSLMYWLWHASSKFFFLRELKKKTSYGVWFLCCNTPECSTRGHAVHAVTQSPNFLSHITTHSHGEGPWFGNDLQLLQENSVCAEWYMWIRFCKTNMSNFNKIGQYSIIWSICSGFCNHGEDKAEHFRLNSK